jgi:hypothetical protein
MKQDSNSNRYDLGQGVAIVIMTIGAMLLVYSFFGK